MNSNERLVYPIQQEIVWVDFQPSSDNEIYGRHPAVVLSTSGFSIITNQVAISPITHAHHNRLNQLFIPVTNNSEVEGFVNPLQFHTFSILGRHLETTSTFLDDAAFSEVIRIHKQILDL